MDWTWFVSLFLASWPGAQAPPPPLPPACQSLPRARAAGLEQARQSLARMPFDESGRRVAPATGAAIERVKDRLIGFVIETLACTAPDAAPTAIHQALARPGHAGAEALDQATEYGTGLQIGGLDYEVARPDGRPDLLAVTVRLGIVCGDDDLLLLFGHRDGHWRPLIVRRSPPYTSIADAFGGLRYAVSPPDRRGGWFLVTTRVTPWCVSVWQGLHYDLSRAGPSPSAPRILFSHAALINIDDEPGEQLHVGQAGFEISYEGGFIDAAILTRRHVEAYAVSGLAVRRTGPLALNPRDFADEWVRAPWREARGWSRTDAGIGRAHASLHRAGAFWWLSGTFRCDDGGHEIVLENERTRWHLLVRGGPAFRLVSASRSSVAHCARPEAVAQD